MKMTRKGVVALSLAGTLALGGGVLITHAYAAGSIESTSTEEKDEEQNDAALQAQAQISAIDATNEALALNSDLKIGKVELEEEEDGQVIYSVNAEDSTGAYVEIKVDAVTGDAVVAEDDADTDGEDGDDEDTEALDFETQISALDAMNVAQAANPDSTVYGVDIEDEDGQVVFTVDTADASGVAYEVVIDATNGSVISTEKDVEDEEGEEDDAALQAQAQISAVDAANAALASNANLTINKVDLEDENGKATYCVEATDETGAIQEVKVDAATGEVVKTEAGDEEESDEAALQAQISIVDAMGAAQAANPDFTIYGADLEDENGQIVFTIDSTDASGVAYEVVVDAENGSVISTDKDVEDASEADDEENDDEENDDEENDDEENE